MVLFCRIPEVCLDVLRGLFQHNLLTPFCWAGPPKLPAETTQQNHQLWDCTASIPSQNKAQSAEPNESRLVYPSEESTLSHDTEMDATLKICSSSKFIFQTMSFMTDQFG